MFVEVDLRMVYNATTYGNGDELHGGFLYPCVRLCCFHGMCYAGAAYVWQPYVCPRGRDCR